MDTSNVVTLGGSSGITTSSGSGGANTYPSILGALQGSTGIVYQGYQGYSQPVTYYDQNMYPIKLRPVENGWILMKDNKEYVLHTAQDIIKYLDNSKT